MSETPFPSGLLQSLRHLPGRLRHTLLRPAADLLLTQSCALCQQTSGDAPICAACARDLPVLSAQRCSKCALPMTAGLMQCPDCAHHPPSFDAAHAAWAYDFPVDTLIRDFKYGHHLYLGRFFAEHLAQSLLRDWASAGQMPPDLIIPVPLHPHRLRTRGFNQAAEIARHLGRLLDIRCDFHGLTRINDTPAQAGLPRSERWHNLVGAFVCPNPLAARHVLLVDDVLTTGASLSACADVLRHAGIPRIDVAVVARTPNAPTPKTPDFS